MAKAWTCWQQHLDDNLPGRRPAEPCHGSVQELHWRPARIPPRCDDDMGYPCAWPCDLRPNIEKNKQLHWHRSCSQYQIALVLVEQCICMFSCLQSCSSKQTSEACNVATYNGRIHLCSGVPLQKPSAEETGHVVPSSWQDQSLKHHLPWCLPWEALHV